MKRSAASYYHNDAIGSVVRLTNSNAALTDTYSYTAFGEVRERSGTNTQPFQYVGNAYDPTTKLHDFHAKAPPPSRGVVTADRRLGQVPRAVRRRR